MANVEHSALTGSNLHESKGVAAATANTVYVADGVGSGAWSTVGTASLAAATKVFQGQLLHVSDQVSSGGGGQGLAGATWNKRNLQSTFTNEISGASVSSSVISLPAGTYFLIGHATWFTSGAITQKGKLRIRNTTDGTTLVNGTSSYRTYTGSGITVTDQPLMGIVGRFTLAGTRNIELQHWVLSACSAGSPTGSGESENYADVMIWKVA